MKTTERGAITIHVALALIALLMFSGIVVDYGVMMIARGQAQAAADAGALAGALTLELNRNDNANAIIAAKHVAGLNAVWAQFPSATDVVVHPLPFPCPAPYSTPDGCIRVDVSRGLPDGLGGAHSNSLSTYLIRLVGPSTQGTRAMAMAQIAAGNALACIKPWVVADKWTDASTGAGSGSLPGAWDQEDTFDPGIDHYTTAGFSATTDIGTQLMLKGDGHDFSSGWSLEIDLGGGNGGSVYQEEIEGCPTWVPTIGLYKPPTPCNVKPDTDYEKGCLNIKTGVKEGPTRSGVNFLRGLDPSATWDLGTNKVIGGCTTAGTCGTINPTGINLSPRIIPIALFDPEAYATGGFSGGGGMAKVVNLLGFFLEGMCDDVYATPPAWCGAHPDKTVVGRLMRFPGSSHGGSSGTATAATFVTFTRLIR